MPRLRPIALLAFALLPGLPARGAADPAVERAVLYLRGQADSQRVGETGLIALAMIKADVPPTDPTVSSCVARIRARLSGGGYTPDRTGGHDIYEAAVAAMVLANFEPDRRTGELGIIAQYIAALQKGNGSWDYAVRTNGDTSISQYAVLGLWEAENAGADVNPVIWDRAAQWFLSVQSPSGSWNYHRDENHPETLSMTAAGVGSLLICRRQLAAYRRAGEGPSPLMVPLRPEGAKPRYDPETKTSRIDRAVERGLDWLAANFNTGNPGIFGSSPYYGLYGFERIIALAERATMNRFHWLEQGRAFLLATQRPNGAWTSAHGEVANTAWGVLFLTRSTAKTLRRIEVKRLGAGTLLGGRGLPRDLSSLTVAGGRVVQRPMNGAIEGMLAVLEDPRATGADSAVAGLVERYEAEGPRALRPHKDRFRKMLTDRDPGVRRVAAWALAHTGDLDVVPALIDLLVDPDDDVVTAARLGLQLLGRKVEGLGPPSPSTPEQRRQAVERWREWYASIRPLDDESTGDETERLLAPPPGRSQR